MKKINIIVPIYKEKDGINHLLKRLVDVIDGIPKYNFKIIIVDDGSNDESPKIVKDYSLHDSRIQLIVLSRNFGKEIALSAGIMECSDVDAAICLDGDLQHPPEYIPTFISKWEAGADVVVGIRSASDNENIFRKISSNLFYWVISNIGHTEILPKSTDFRLIDLKIINEFKKIPEKNRIFRGIIDWMGFKKELVYFTAAERSQGPTQYSSKKLIRLAINSIVSYSFWPLRLSGYAGLIISIANFLFLVYMLIDRLFWNGLNASPMAWVLVFNTFFIGLLLSSIGLVALYIETIHTETLNRPLYLIQEKYNFPNK